jgi:type IV secretion system protein VirB11
MRENSTATTIALNTEHRMDAMMMRYLGADIMAAFDDDNVTEIYTNPQDTLVRLITRSHGRIVTVHRMSADRVTMFLDSVAAHIGVVLDGEHASLEAELPEGRFRKARVQGFLSPISRGPAFALRKPPNVIYALDEYVERGTLSSTYRTVLRSAVQWHLNLLIVGGTDTGKTTFGNALLREVSEVTPDERVVILEDTIELQCASPDYLALRTRPDVSLADLVKMTLRTSPDRIVVGEVRDASALALLDAWTTGHPGGIATLHANDARGALHRLDRLAQRNNVPSQRELIAEAIDLIIVLDKRNGERRVVDLVRVTGLDQSRDFRLESFAEARDEPTVNAFLNTVSHDETHPDHHSDKKPR